MSSVGQPAVVAQSEVSAVDPADTGFDIRVVPAGAAVALDGHDIGLAPLRIRNMQPGHHIIDVQREGFFSKRVEVDLAGGTPVNVPVALEPVAMPLEPAIPSPQAVRVTPTRAAKPAFKRAPRSKRWLGSRKPAKHASSSALGTLMLGAKPPCDIIIDGKRTGMKTPQRSIKLSTGTHHVILSSRTFGLRSTFKVKIASGKTTKVIRDMSDQI